MTCNNRKPYEKLSSLSQLKKKVKSEIIIKKMDLKIRAGNCDRIIGYFTFCDLGIDNCVNGNRECYQRRG